MSNVEAHRRALQGSGVLKDRPPIDPCLCRDCGEASQTLEMQTVLFGSHFLQFPILAFQPHFNQFGQGAWITKLRRVD
jgi:hypothetical protein